MAWARNHGILGQILGAMMGAACLAGGARSAGAKQPPPRAQEVAQDPPPGADDPRAAPPAGTKPAEVADRKDKGDKADKKEGEPEVNESRVFGLQLAGTHAPGYPDTGLSGSVFGQNERFVTDGERSDHEATRFSLGGGSAGFDGAIETAGRTGLNGRIGKELSVVGRVGFQAWVWGNRQIYSSLFTIPEGELGVQIKRGVSLFEVGVRGGAVLIGRFRPGVEESRKLGRSGQYGAYASLHLAPLRLGVEFMRVDSLSDEAVSPVDNLRGSLCVTPSSLAFCLRGDWLHGSTPAGGPRSYDGVYVGTLLGVSGL